MSNPDNKWLLGLSNELLLLVLKFVTPNEIMIQWGPSADSSGASEAMSYRAARHPNAKMVFITSSLEDVGHQSSRYLTPRIVSEIYSRFPARASA